MRCCPRASIIELIAMQIMRQELKICRLVGLIWDFPFGLLSTTGVDSSL